MSESTRICTACGFAVGRWQHRASCLQTVKNPLLARLAVIEPVTNNRTDIQDVVNKRTEAVTPEENKRTRGRP